MFAFALAVTVVLFILGVPIYITFGMGGLLLLVFYSGMSLEQLGAMLFSSLDSFVLLAIPLFILAGNLMITTGIGGRLVDFIASLIGRVPGGLGIAAVMACVFVSSLTGAIPAALAAVGIIMFPAMLEAGYDRGYSAGVLAIGSHLGNLIPPSCGFILFGYLAQASVAKLFIAGIIPGLIVAIALILVAVVIAKRKRFPLKQAVSWRDKEQLFIKALPGIFMPVIVLGGIYSGTFTPTEAAAVACVYCFVIYAVINRGIDWKAIWGAITNSVRATAFIMILIVSAIVISKAFTLVGFTRIITEWVAAANLGATGFLLVLTLVFIIATFFMDATAMIFICVPLFLPAVQLLDINILHLGVIIIIAGSVGATTPPMAVHLYITSGLFKVPVDEVIRGLLPFLIAFTVVLFICVFFPILSTWLPGVLMGS